jgi:hypothetical protein
LKPQVSESSVKILGHFYYFPIANEWSSRIWITPSIRYSFVFQRIGPVHNMQQTRDRIASLPREKLRNPERGRVRQILILIRLILVLMWLQSMFRHPGCKGSYISVMIVVELDESLEN